MDGLLNGLTGPVALCDCCVEGLNYRCIMPIIRLFN